VSDQQATQNPALSGREESNASTRRLHLGIAVAGWLFIFGLANVVPSEPYRMCFDPTVAPPQTRLNQYRSMPLAMPLFPTGCLDSRPIVVAEQIDKSAAGMEFPRFRGHLTAMVTGVHDAQNPPAVCGRFA
jgi:hypothetical protein